MSSRSDDDASGGCALHCKSSYERNFVMQIFLMPGLIVLHYKKRGFDNRDTAITQLHFVWNK
jgi:hypothetical protein